MAEARQQAQWQHTAALLTLLANINRDPKKRSQPFEVADFMPATGRPPVRPKGDIKMLKVFVKKG